MENFLQFFAKITYFSKKVIKLFVWSSYNSITYLRNKFKKNEVFTQKRGFALY